MTSWSSVGQSFPLITSTVASHHRLIFCRRSFIMNRTYTLKYMYTKVLHIKDQCIAHPQSVSPPTSCLYTPTLSVFSPNNSNVKLMCSLAVHPSLSVLLTYICVLQPLPGLRSVTLCLTKVKYNHFLDLSNNNAFICAWMKWNCPASEGKRQSGRYMWDNSDYVVPQQRLSYISGLMQDEKQWIDYWL